jgi:hypothetical protein
LLLRRLLLVCWVVLDVLGIALISGLVPVCVLPSCQLLKNRSIIGSILLLVLHAVHRCISLYCRGVRCLWLLTEEQLLL